MQWQSRKNTERKRVRQSERARETERGGGRDSGERGECEQYRCVEISEPLLYQGLRCLLQQLHQCRHSGSRPCPASIQGEGTFQNTRTRTVALPRNTASFQGADGSCRNNAEPERTCPTLAADTQDPGSHPRGHQAGDQHTWLPQVPFIENDSIPNICKLAPLVHLGTFLSSRNNCLLQLRPGSLYVVAIRYRICLSLALSIGIMFRLPTIPRRKYLQVS